MQLDRVAIESALPRKGFAEDRAGHHRYFYHEYGGKRTSIYTYTSHGSGFKAYGDPLLRSMRLQLQLDSVDSEELALSMEQKESPKIFSGSDSPQ